MTGIVLREPQAGLRVSGMSRDVRGGELPGVTMDRARQSVGPVQPLIDVVARRGRCGEVPGGHPNSPTLNDGPGA